jgi:hypothetical protein
MALAQEPATPSAGEPMAQVQRNMDAMREQMAQIHATQDPQERQRLMHEHMRSMHQGMMMMGQCMGMMQQMMQQMMEQMAVGQATEPAGPAEPPAGTTAPAAPDAEAEDHEQHH